MRPAFRHLLTMMSLLFLTTGVMLVSSTGANAHQSMSVATNIATVVQTTVSPVDDGVTCISLACQPGHSKGCCHPAGASCSTLMAMYAATADTATSRQQSLYGLPRASTGLNGLAPPVAQRPPSISV